MISAIDKFTPIIGADQAQAASETGDSLGMFASIFQSAIDNVKETEAEVVANEYLLATGQLDNPALLSIAETKSELAVSLLVQLRNKALEAYQEITRISF